MFSVSPAELVTIAVVALLVFGPQRLPEIARKLGKLAKEVSRAANELKAGIEREYDEAAEPLSDVRRRLGSTVEDPPTKRPGEEPTGRPAGEPPDDDRPSEADE